MTETSPNKVRVLRVISLLTLSALVVLLPAPPRTSASSPAIPGRARTTTTFTNATPVALPIGTAMISSQITVSGVDPYLWDLDVQTFITHSWCGDLDITLTSPAGTIVTLTTDNGGTNADVFNGTLWDDQANPGGQVPYTHNPGLVTDRSYADGVVATPLVPGGTLRRLHRREPQRRVDPHHLRRLPGD